ncbi:MAG: hypothetical protein EOO39_39135 [Cytophagaceae bacterium]|nr:MAG: hypothetical protein EOO39_39135 [Cytophagaceae bacterium]
MSSLPVSPTLRRFVRQLKTFVRASEWWGHKFSPLLATAYATASLSAIPLWPLLPVFLLQLLGLTVGAVYVSLLNDWTDRTVDLAAGKPNRLAGRSPQFAALILGLCLLTGLLLSGYFWILSPPVGLWYGVAWIVYSLYSLPPARLKEKAFWGILADATGAHLCPQLFTIGLVGYWSGHTPSLPFWWAVGGWSLACGIRNILWHQLSDEAADRRAGIRTFVTHVGAYPARQLGLWVFFPVEVACLGVMFALLNLPLLWLSLGGYVLLEGLRWRCWRQRPQVLAPHQRILLNEYYITLYPLALLLTQLSQYALDGIVLLVHLLLFGGHFAALFQNVRPAHAVIQD